MSKVVSSIMTIKYIYTQTFYEELKEEVMRSHKSGGMYIEKGDGEL